LLAKLGYDVGKTRIGRAAMLRVAQMIAPVTVPVAGAVGRASPYAIGAGLGAYALQSELGQEVVGLRPDLTYDPESLVAERGRQDRLRFERFVQDTLALAPMRRKKRMTKFNQAVKKGMAIVKASTSYGKKGVISSPKKAFSAVTKAVSKVSKAQKAGKKKPKSGNVAIKKVLTAAAKILEKRSPAIYRPGKRTVKKKKDYRDYDPQGTMFD